MQDTSPRHKFLPSVPPFLIAVVLAIGYGYFTRLLFGADYMSDLLTTLSFGFLCFVPAAIGAVTVYVAWPHEHVSAWRAISAPWMPSLIFLAAVVAFNLEVAICIVMASPLFFLMTSIGGGIMAAILNVNERRSPPVNSLLVALLIAPYMISALEGRTPAQTTVRTVPTQIVIDAPVEVVWENIIRVPEILPSERQLRLAHIVGVPQPVEALLSFEGVGGVRDASFDNGLVFVETITDWTPMETISFTIDPHMPETMPVPFNQLGGVFDVIDGTYRIESIGENRVTLHLSSTHRLTSGINAYGSIWTEHIMWDLQTYILEIIKARCESQAALQ